MVLASCLNVRQTSVPRHRLPAWGQPRHAVPRKIKMRRLAGFFTSSNDASIAVTADASTSRSEAGLKAGAACNGSWWFITSAKVTRSHAEPMTSRFSLSMTWLHGMIRKYLPGILHEFVKVRGLAGREVETKQRSAVCLLDGLRLAIAAPRKGSCYSKRSEELPPAGEKQIPRRGRQRSDSWSQTSASSSSSSCLLYRSL